MPALNPALESIFAKATGYTPRTAGERAFLTSAAQRKSGPALFGAIQSAQQRGEFSQQPASGQPQGQTSGGGDQLTEIMDKIKNAGMKVEKANQNLLKKDVQLSVRAELLKSPAIQKLMQAEGKADTAAGAVDTSVEPSTLARPTQQGALKSTDMSNAIQAQGDIGRAFATRGQGITDMIAAITQGREQELQQAQTEQQSQESILQRLLQVQGERREQELFPLKRQQLELGLQTERLQQQKIQADIAKIEQGETLSPSERLAYSKALGVPPSQVEAAIAEGINPADVEAKQTVAQAQVKLDPRLKTIRDAIPRMEAAVGKVNTTNSYVGQIQKYGPFAALRGKDPDIAELETFKALRASLARLTGEVGNLSEGEQKSVGNAFIPEWTDSAQKAEQKLNAIKNFMSVLSVSANPQAVAKEAANSDPNSILEQYSGVQASDEIDLFLDSF